MCIEYNGYIFVRNRQAIWGELKKFGPSLGKMGSFILKSEAIISFKVVPF